jgi:3-hydroxybutyryl-CoA dehydratase
MSDFYVAIGDTSTFSKTVGEYDVYTFAGVSGDFAPNHVNKAYMEKSSYGGLIAHGALLVGYMSTASTLMAAKSRNDPTVTGVSLGYDRMRFLAPVFFGDTITVAYTIASIDRDKLRAAADVRITNQDGTLVAVATHLLKWVRNGAAGS